MKKLSFVTAILLAGCASDPYGGLTNQQLRDMNLDSGPIPSIQSAIPMIDDAVKARLKDPDSATFEWPNEFRGGGYTPLAHGHVNGYFTCGSVNAKNGYGGYVGKTAVIVVVSNGSVQYVDLDQGPYFPIAAECAEIGMPVR